MKAFWEQSPLGEACEFVSTGPFGSLLKKDEYQETGVPIVNPIDIVHCKVSSDGIKRVNEKTASRLSQYRMRAGDIVIGRRGELGRCAVIGEGQQGWLCGTGSFFLRPRKNLDSRYLCSFLGSPDARNYFERASTGATMPNISNKTLSKLVVPHPPLEKQKRIVAVLDEAFAAIDRARAHAEANLTNARELFEAALLSTFGEMNEAPEMLTLKQVSIDFSRGKSKHRPRNDKTLYGGEYPFIQTGDVRNCDHVISSYTQTYNEKGLSQSKLWPKGTVCITIAANIAETGILGFDACFPDSIIGAIPNEERTSADYLEFLLQFFHTRLQARGEGSAQANINLRTFETEFFPFPSLETQRRMISNIGAVSKHVEDLSSRYERKFSEIDDLRQSLLQRAFAGELT